MKFQIRLEIHKFKLMNNTEKAAKYQIILDKNIVYLQAPITNIRMADIWFELWVSNRVHKYLKTQIEIQEKDNVHLLNLT